MKTLLITGFILLTSVASSLAQPFPFQRQSGLGVDRENLNPELLDMRTVLKLKALEYWIMNRKGAKEAPDKIFAPHIWNEIQIAAARCEANPYDVAGLINIESQGDPDAESDTGPLGLLQYAKVTALENDMTIRHGTVKVKYQKRIGRGKKSRLVTKTRSVRQIVYDERRDPLKSIQAFGRSFCNNYATYSRPDAAYQTHHNGAGRFKWTVGKYVGLDPRKLSDNDVGDLIAQHGLTVPMLYFGNTPYHNTEFYQYIKSVRNSDFGDSYFLRIKTSSGLMELAHKDRDAYDALYEKYNSGYAPSGATPSRRNAFFSAEQFQELQFQDLKAIHEAINEGRLVPLPAPWKNFGYEVQMSRASDKLQAPTHGDLLYAEPATIGVLITIMNELKLLQKDKFEPYRIGTLVWDNSRIFSPRLSEVHQLNLHTLGKALDFPVRGLSERRLDDLLFILSDMDSMGMISDLREHEIERYKVGRKWHTRKVLSAIDVTPNPQWEAYFSLVYRQATGQFTTSTTNTQ